MKGRMMSPLSLWDHLSERFASPPTGESPRDRGAAMVFTVLFMLMLAGVSVLMLGVIVGQIAPSLSAQNNTRAGYSAQAGLQVGLGAIRAAEGAPDGAGVVYGNRAALPCTVTGSADGVTNDLPFTVQVRYFTLDPSERDAAWLDANDLACIDGAGVANQPRYALVVAAGESINDANATFDRDRAMSAVYEFKLTNINIPGGRIFNFERTHCMRAVTAASDSRLAFFPVAQCNDDDRELFIYDRNWNLVLASTTTPGDTPLCITGPVSAPLNSTQDARLRACFGPTDAARWSQLWSWVGSDNWRGQRENISGGNSNFCLTTPAGTNITGQFLIARHNGCGGQISASPEVGAGAAGFATQQIVNFKQFGRCADVTGESVTAAYMIVFPCKQDPTGTGREILWNHKWVYQEPTDLAGSLGGQEISVLNRDRLHERRCLTTQPNTSSNRYVVFQICTGDARQSWTRVAQAAAYEGSWLFVDTFGRCLDIDVVSLHRSQFAKMTTVACNGTEEQKWNAPPNSTTATFGGFREVAN